MIVSYSRVRNLAGSSGPKRYPLDKKEKKALEQTLKAYAEAGGNLTLQEFTEKTDVSERQIRKYGFWNELKATVLGTHKPSPQSLTKWSDTRISSTLGAIRDARLDAPIFKAKKFDSKETTLVLHNGDAHSGKKVKSHTGKVIYNDSIMKDRYGDLFDYAVWRIKRFKGQYDCLTILCTGDMVDGSDVYQNQMVNQSIYHVPIQARQVASCIYNGIAHVIKKTGIHVKFEACAGNHGGGDVDNWDLVVYEFLNLMGQVAKLPAEFRHSNGLGHGCFHNCKINGFQYHLRHKTPPQTETQASRGRIGGWHGIHGWHVMCVGHFHSDGKGNFIGHPIIRCGSMAGSDDFAESLSYDGPAEQSFWDVTKADYLNNRSWKRW